MNSKRGLYEKYLIAKNKSGELIDNGFVLRPDRDPAAKQALAFYAFLVLPKNHQLSKDILTWLEGLDETSDF